MTKKKNNTLHSRLYWLLIPFAFIVWSLGPQPALLRTMNVNESLIDPALTQSCPLLAQVVQYDYEVKIPRRIWKSEAANIILTLRAPADMKVLNEEALSACSLAVETDLSAADLIAEPGETLIEPFIGQKNQSFVYTVNLRNAQVASGSLWIYAKLKAADASSVTRLPLFSIPLEIGEVSILGLPPMIVRYIALLVMLILLAFYFRGKLNERK
jgi:hypothetical protein